MLGSLIVIVVITLFLLSSSLLCSFHDLLVLEKLFSGKLLKLLFLPFLFDLFIVDFLHFFDFFRLFLSLALSIHQFSMLISQSLNFLFLFTLFCNLFSNFVFA